MTRFIIATPFIMLIVAAVACSPVEMITTPIPPPTDMTDSPNSIETLVSEPGIVGITWLWERFDDSAGMNNIVVDDPSLYTLTFNADSFYKVTTECYSSGGYYTLDSGSIVLAIDPLSLVDCPKGSLADIYLNKLSTATTYVIDSNKLVLNLSYDSGHLVFKPSTP